MDQMNQLEFHMVQNRKENCHHDHIPFNVKGNGNIVFSVQNYCHHQRNKTAFLYGEKVVSTYTCLCVHKVLMKVDIGEKVTTYT